MKLAYHVLTHLFGLGCIAACFTIVYTMGKLDIHWSGWIAIGYFAVLAVGIIVGWFPWRGRPLQILIKGVYVMSALALIGFGFSMQDPLRPQLWIVLAVLGAAILARIIFKLVMLSRGKPAARPAPSPAPSEPTTRATDPLL